MPFNDGKKTNGFQHFILSDWHVEPLCCASTDPQLRKKGCELNPTQWLFPSGWVIHQDKERPQKPTRQERKPRRWRTVESWFSCTPLWGRKSCWLAASWQLGWTSLPGGMGCPRPQETPFFWLEHKHPVTLENKHNTKTMQNTPPRSRPGWPGPASRDGTAWAALHRGNGQSLGDGAGRLFAWFSRNNHPN